MHATVQGLDHDRICSNFTQIKFRTCIFIFLKPFFLFFDNKSVKNISNYLTSMKMVKKTCRTYRKKINTIRSARKWQIQWYPNQPWAIKNKTAMAIYVKPKMSSLSLHSHLVKGAGGHNLSFAKRGNWSARSRFRF